MSDDDRPRAEAETAITPNRTDKQNRRPGCFGCLLRLLLVPLWLLLALLPAGIADDLLGPPMHAYWPVFSDAATGPAIPDGQTVKADVLTVKAGARVSITVDPAIVVDVVPTLQCAYQDGGDWMAFPMTRVPIDLPKTRNASEPSPVVVGTFTSRSGRPEVRCVGSEVVHVRQDDVSVQRRFTWAVRLSRIAWVVLITALFLVPSALLARRRLRRALQGMDPSVLGRAGRPGRGTTLEPGANGNIPPWGTPPPADPHDPGPEAFPRP